MIGLYPVPCGHGIRRFGFVFRETQDRRARNRLNTLHIILKKCGEGGTTTRDLPGRFSRDLRDECDPASYKLFA